MVRRNFFERSYLLCAVLILICVLAVSAMCDETSSTVLKSASSIATPESNVSEVSEESTSEDVSESPSEDASKETVEVPQKSTTSQSLSEMRTWTRSDDVQFTGKKIRVGKTVLWLKMDKDKGVLVNDKPIDDYPEIFQNAVWLAASSHSEGIITDNKSLGKWVESQPKQSVSVPILSVFFQMDSGKIQFVPLAALSQKDADLLRSEFDQWLQQEKLRTIEEERKRASDELQRERWALQEHQAILYQRQQQCAYMMQQAALIQARNRICAPAVVAAPVVVTRKTTNSSSQSSSTGNGSTGNGRLLYGREVYGWGSGSKW